MRRPSRHAVTGFLAVALLVLMAIIYGFIYELQQGMRSVPW